MLCDMLQALFISSKGNGIIHTSSSHRAFALRNNPMRRAWGASENARSASCDSSVRDVFVAFRIVVRRFFLSGKGL